MQALCPTAKEGFPVQPLSFPALISHLTHLPIGEAQPEHIVYKHPQRLHRAQQHNVADVKLDVPHVFPEEQDGTFNVLGHNLEDRQAGSLCSPQLCTLKDLFICKCILYFKRFIYVFRVLVLVYECILRACRGHKTVSDILNWCYRQL